MLKLTRPEGTPPEDLHQTRRALGGLFFAGYAVAAVSANARQQAIFTDTQGLIAQAIRIPGRDQSIPCYIARPDARGRFASIVVVPEVFGLHEYIRDVCRRLAKLGYVAIAPDPFFRAGDPASLSDFSQIQRIVSTATNEQVMGDLGDVGLWLERQNFTTNRYGVTGFCWGGAVVWMAMARYSGLRAGVAWYGRLRRPPRDQFLGAEERPWPIDVASQLHGPVLGLYAGQDQGIPVADVEAMEAALQRSGKRGSDIVVYPNAQHGFHADYRATYDAASAIDGWGKMLDHFNRNGVQPRLPPRR